MGATKTDAVRNVEAGRRRAVSALTTRDWWQSGLTPPDQGSVEAKAARARHRPLRDRQIATVRRALRARGRR